MIWGDAAARRPRGVLRALALALAAGGVLLLSGCVATDVVPAGDVRPTGPVPSVSSPAPTLTPAPTPTPVVGEQVISGVGPQVEERIRLAVPRATRSVRIDLRCEAETRFSAELGDATVLGQSALAGECDGDRTLAWPWEIGSSTMLALWVAPDVAWTASVTYSEEPFPQDAALVRECEVYADVYSQVSNADNGYGFYAAFGADEWNARVDAAAAGLVALTRSSSSELGDDFAAMHTVLAERSPIPGGMTEVQEFWQVHTPIVDTCAWNHSEVIVSAEFGG